MVAAAVSAIAMIVAVAADFATETAADGRRVAGSAVAVMKAADAAALARAALVPVRDRGLTPVFSTR